MSEQADPAVEASRGPRGQSDCGVDASAEASGWGAGLTNASKPGSGGLGKAAEPLHVRLAGWLSVVAELASGRVDRRGVGRYALCSAGVESSAGT